MSTGAQRAGDWGTEMARSRTVRLLSALALLLVALPGCAAGGAAGSGAAAPAEAPAADVEEARSGSASEAGPEVDVVSATSAGRQVISAELTVAVDDIAAAAAEVRLLASDVGGFVAAESTTAGESPRADLTLRVPVLDAPTVLDRAGALGQEVARRTTAEDVETRLVDLESRTATQRASIERVRALLEEAQTLSDVITLESELASREADLESVDAQRAALEGRAALATVTVGLAHPDDVSVVAAELPPFLAGLDGGWRALLASTAVVLTMLGALLPFAVVASVVAALAWGLVRRLRRRGGPVTPRVETAG